MDGGTFGNVLVKPVFYSDSKCVICSKRASGVHYGVVACEGCKVRFSQVLQGEVNFHTMDTPVVFSVPLCTIHVDFLVTVYEFFFRRSTGAQ